LKHLTHVSCEPVDVSDGDDLEQTTRRPLYANIAIGVIRCGNQAPDSGLSKSVPKNEKAKNRA